MEEILASIRQIMADDPASDQSEPPIEANPLVPSREIRPAEPRSPLADRLSDVLKGGSLPPTSPLGTKRSLSFDHDLADMFEERAPADNGPVVVPEADIRVPPVRAPMPAKPFVPPMAVVPPNEKMAVPPPNDKVAVVPPPEKATLVTPSERVAVRPFYKNDEPIAAKEIASEKDESTGPAAAAHDAAALPPRRSPSGAFVPPLPFGGGEKPAEVAPPTRFGFPPLRKTSFYPPEPKAPTPARPAATGGFFPSQPRAPAPAPAPEPAAAASPDAAAPLGEAANGPHGIGSKRFFGEAEPSTAGTRSPEPQPASSGAAPKPDAPLFGAGERRFSPFAAAASPAASPAPAPLSPAPAGDPIASPFSTAPEARPVEPRLHTDPFSQDPFSHDPFSPTARPDASFAAGPRLGAEPALGPDAAHQALDALAQGLAASAAHTSVPSEDLSPAIALTPVFEDPDADQRARPAPSTLPAPRPAHASAPVNRTLEDAVADMLRPMLQQWVAENMPRIIERALRTEVAQIVKPGTKPPGA